MEEQRQERINKNISEAYKALERAKKSSQEAGRLIEQWQKNIAENEPRTKGFYK